MNKLIIGLDYDGTILNSFYRHQKVLYDCVTELDTYLHISEIDDLIDYKREGINTLSYLKIKKIENQKLIFNHWLQKIEEDKYFELDYLFPNTITLLKRLSVVADVFLVTARKNKEGTLRQISDLEIGQYFTDIFITSALKNVGHEKYKITKGIPFDYIIGDTSVDLIWASESRTEFFPVNYGFRSSLWWISQGYRSFDSLLSITNIIERGK